MELWVIKDESSLCGINREVFEKDEYGMSISIGMLINTVDSELNAKNNYMTVRDGPENEFSISIYRPEHKDVHYITIHLTDDESKYYTYETIKTAGDLPLVNSIHYFPLGAISRKTTVALSLYTNLAKIASVASILLTLFRDDALLGAMLNTGLIVVPSIISGLL